MAHALVAGEVRTVAERVEQRHTWLDFQLQAFAVHHQRNRHITRPEDTRAGLRFGLRHSGRGDRRGEAGHARTLQEFSAADCHGGNDTAKTPRSLRTLYREGTKVSKNTKFF